jgi:hypothetical protein
MLVVIARVGIEMGSVDSINWEIIKRDMGRWLKKGFVVCRCGTLIVKRKADEMNEEGKRQFQLIELKAKVHNRISDLGARVYSLLATKSDNPALDTKVKDITAHIKRYQAEITRLEEKQRKVVKRRIRRSA